MNAEAPNPIQALSSSESESGSLAGYSTCEISDALIKLGLPHGGHIPDITMFSPSSDDAGVRICGAAYTVKMVSASDKDAPVPERHFVDAAPRRSVMVISVPLYVKSAVWGGLMTAGAQAQGVRGVIIDGRCRDITEHRAANFPVFARGRSTLGQGTFTRPSELNVPITINPVFSYMDYHSADRLRIGDYGNDSRGFGLLPPVTVNPGDVIVADVDGVVCVPRELVEGVVEKCRIGREVDAKCLVDIRAGKGIADSFKTWREK